MERRVARGDAHCARLAVRAVHRQSFPRATPPGVTVDMPAGLLTCGSSLGRVFPSRLGATVTLSGVANRSQLRGQSRSRCLMATPHRVPFSFPLGKPTAPWSMEGGPRSRRFGGPADHWAEAVRQRTRSGRPRARLARAKPGNAGAQNVLTEMPTKVSSVSILWPRRRLALVLGIPNARAATVSRKPSSSPRWLSSKVTLGLRKPNAARAK